MVVLRRRRRRPKLGRLGGGARRRRRWGQGGAPAAEGEDVRPWRHRRAAQTVRDGVGFGQFSCRPARGRCSHRVPLGEVAEVGRRGLPGISSFRGWVHDAIEAATAVGLNQL